MENNISYAKKLFLCMAKEFFCDAMPEITGLTILGNSPWEKDEFRVDVEYPDGAMKNITAYVYPDRKEIWRFSLEPEAETEKFKEKEEKKKDPLEEWVEKNKEAIMQLQMTAENEGKSYFLISASLFPGEEIKEMVVEWLRDLGDYSFAGIVEDTGDVSVLLCE